MDFDELGNERINLGGFLLTRAEAFRVLVDRGADLRSTTYAMSAPAISDAEAVRWPEVLTGLENYTTLTRPAA